jgi:hypothetical protein
MRGFAALLAYVVGLSAVVSIGIIGVMALPKPMPSAQPVPAASQKERLAKPAKQVTTVAQKDAQPNQKRKVAHVTRKQKDEAPTIASSGFPYTYGYAAEPRRYYQYPIQFFGR